MRPPIVIAEGLDVSFYGSAEAAALALEGPDVIDGVYRAYDADGRPLDLKSAGAATDYSAAVDLRLQPQAPPDVRGLSLLLRAHLSAIGERVPDDASLPALLRQAVARNGLAG